MFLQGVFKIRSLLSFPCCAKLLYTGSYLEWHHPYREGTRLSMRTQNCCCIITPNMGSWGAKHLTPESVHFLILVEDFLLPPILWVCVCVFWYTRWSVHPLEASWAKKIKNKNKKIGQKTTQTCSPLIYTLMAVARSFILQTKKEENYLERKILYSFSGSSSQQKS